MARFRLRALETFRAVAVIAGVALIASGCGGSTWVATPSEPPAARGFAATACSNDAMFIHGGALPTAGSKDRLVDGAYVLESDGWEQVPEPDIVERTGAVAVSTTDGAAVLVWGGTDGTTFASTPEDLGYLNDGALFSEGTWTSIAPFVDDGRFDYQVVASGDTFIVLAAAIGADTPPTARIVEHTGRERELEVPFTAGVLTGGDDVYHFGPSGVHQLRLSPGPQWSAVSDAPFNPAFGSGRGPVAAIVQGSSVWVIAEGGLREIDSPPNGPVDSIHAVEGGVVTWNAEAATAAMWNVERQEWSAVFGAPRAMTDRSGSSVCATASDLIVWGGWTDRGTLHVASETGYRISLERLRSDE